MILLLNNERLLAGVMSEKPFRLNAMNAMNAAIKVNSFHGQLILLH